jgi:hypothetical protein
MIGTLLELVWSCTKIGLLAFGGGKAAIPLLAAEAMPRWISEQEFGFACLEGQCSVSLPSGRGWCPFELSGGHRDRYHTVLYVSRPPASGDIHHVCRVPARMRYHRLDIYPGGQRDMSGVVMLGSPERSR